MELAGVCVEIYESYEYVRSRATLDYIERYCRPSPCWPCCCGICHAYQRRKRAETRQTIAPPICATNLLPLRSDNSSEKAEKTAALSVIHVVPPPIASQDNKAPCEFALLEAEVVRAIACSTRSVSFSRAVLNKDSSSVVLTSCRVESSRVGSSFRRNVEAKDTLESQETLGGESAEAETLDENDMHLERLREERVREILNFGNFAIFDALVDGAAPIVAIGFMMLMPVASNPFLNKPASFWNVSLDDDSGDITIQPSQEALAAKPIPRATIVLNVFIMLFFESILGDAIVGTYSHKLYLKNSEGYISLPLIWAARNRTAYFFMLFASVIVASFCITWVPWGSCVSAHGETLLHYARIKSDILNGAYTDVHGDTTVLGGVNGNHIFFDTDKIQVMLIECPPG